MERWRSLWESTSQGDGTQETSDGRLSGLDFEMKSNNNDDMVFDEISDNIMRQQSRGHTVRK